MSSNNSPNPYIPNLYNSNNFALNSSSLTLAEANQLYLQLTGGTVSGNLLCSSSLTVSGSTTLASLIASGSTTLSNTTLGSSAILISSNTTLSTSSSTGALQIAGGAYFGNDSIFNR